MVSQLTKDDRRPHRGNTGNEVPSERRSSDTTPKPPSRWWPWVRGGFAVALVLVAVGAWVVGQASTVLLLGPAVVVIATVAQRVVARFQGRLVSGFVTDPLAVENRGFLAQFTIRALLSVLVIAGAVLTIPRFETTDGQYLGIFWLIAGPAAVFAALQLLPSRPVSRSLNAVVAIVVAFLGFQLISVHLNSGLDDAVSLASPVEGEWTVTSGGRSTLVSHHYAVMFPQQRDAIDLAISRDGQTYQGDKSDPTSYHAWDQPLLAPADGTVVKVENELQDWPIGERESDMDKAPGNHVIIDIGQGRYVLLAHLKMGTATVSEGDQVTVGEEIGRVGNSGNTAQPHLHFQIQDSPTFTSDAFSNEVQTFPIEFNNVTHIRGGTEHAGQQDQLRRNDTLRTEG